MYFGRIAAEKGNGAAAGVNRRPHVGQMICDPLCWRSTGTLSPQPGHSRCIGRVSDSSLIVSGLLLRGNSYSRVPRVLACPATSRWAPVTARGLVPQAAPGETF